VVICLDANDLGSHIIPVPEFMYVCL